MPIIIFFDAWTCYADELDRLINRLNKGFTEPTIKRAVTERFKEGEKKMFNSSSTWQGRRWKPVDIATRDRKRGNKVGFDTGTLYRSLTGGGGFIERAAKRQIVLGTRVPYAAEFDARAALSVRGPRGVGTGFYTDGLFEGMRGGA